MDAMRIHASIKGCSVAALAVLALACKNVDIGQQCNVLPASVTPAQDECTVKGDLVSTQNYDCDTLFCIVTPKSKSTCDSTTKRVGGRCTKSCVSNDDCFPSDTGMECRRVVLDSDFINELEKTNPDLLAKYLGDLRTTSFCAEPLPPTP
jgi:hypothetical protein